MTTDILTVLLIIAATHRTTRLITTDHITHTPRIRAQYWLEHRWEEKHQQLPHPDMWRSKLAYMLGCIWCMSIWTSAAITTITALTVTVPAPGLVWLAASTFTGLLDQLDQT